MAFNLFSKKPHNTTFYHTNSFSTFFQDDPALIFYGPALNDV